MSSTHAVEAELASMLWRMSTYEARLTQLRERTGVPPRHWRRRRAVRIVQNIFLAVCVIGALAILFVLCTRSVPVLPRVPV